MGHAPLAPVVCKAGPSSPAPTAADLREAEITAAITIAVLSSPRIVEECLKSPTTKNLDMAVGVVAFARAAAAEIVKPLRGGKS